MNYMKTKISLIKIAVSLCGGILGSFIGNIIYALLIDQWWKPFVVAIFFLILALSIFLPLFITSKALGDFDYFVKNPINKSVFKYLLPIVLIGIFLISMLLEFLYEIGGDWSVPEPTSYVFALDISGSMQSTDPNFKESEAVSKIVNQMSNNFPFAVYTFSDDVECIEEMHNKSKDDINKNWKFNYDGGTSMYGVLNKILDDYNNNKNSSDWVGGNAPRIILVSDGYPTDGDFFGRKSYDVAKSCRSNGVSICGISVVGADQELMKKLSENTGGKSFSIDDIDGLYDSLSSALTAKYFGDRTLISYRGFVNNDALYCVLRIVFLAVIAFLYGFLIYLANALYIDLKPILVIKVVTAIVAGVAFEFSVQAFLGNEILSRINLCVLIGACLLRTIYLEKKYITSLSNNNGSSEKNVITKTSIKTLDNRKEKSKIKKIGGIEKEENNNQKK